MSKDKFAYVTGSTEAPDGMKTVYGNSVDSDSTFYIPDEVYCERDGRKLRMQLMYPSCPPELMRRQMERVGRMGGPKRDRAENPGYPLIIYIQGSSWLKQDCYKSLLKLAPFVRAGFAVASVEYRESTAAKWPAQLQDVKTAIRFLRAKSEFYGIDKERIGVWGDSSGGHMALMAASTSWTEEFDDGLFADESSAVNCCVDFYGPSDLAKINDAPRAAVFAETPSEFSPEGILVGGINLNENPEAAAAISPVTYIRKDREYPPFLIMHGDEDGMVPFNQSVLMYEKLKACDKRAELYKVCGAGHGVNFWTKEVLEIVLKFFCAYM